MNSFFHIQSLQLLQICMDLWHIWIMFLYVFFWKIIKVNHFLYHFIILLHLISSFSFTRSFLVPYAYVSVESVDCILLSSFELKAILLISSVKTLCLSLLNLCCVFDINLMFFMNSLFKFPFSLDNYFILKLSSF